MTTITPSKTLPVERRSTDGRGGGFAPVVQVYLSNGESRDMLVANTIGEFVVIDDDGAMPCEDDPRTWSQSMLAWLRWPESGSLIYDWPYRGSEMRLLGRIERNP
jgi:hypothetical protein